MEAEKIKKQARVDAEEIKTQARAAAETQARAAADRIVDQIRSEARSRPSRSSPKHVPRQWKRPTRFFLERAPRLIWPIHHRTDYQQEEEKKQQHQQRGEAAALELGIRASETEREYEAAIKTLRSDLTDAKMQAETMEKALSIYTDHYTYVARLSRAAGNASMRRCYVIETGPAWVLPSPSRILGRIAFLSLLPAPSIWATRSPSTMGVTSWGKSFIARR